MLLTFAVALFSAVIGGLITFYLSRGERKRKLKHFKKLDAITRGLEAMEQAENEPQKYLADLLGRFFTLTLYGFGASLILIAYVLLNLWQGWGFKHFNIPTALFLGFVIGSLAAYPSIIWGFMAECAWLLEPDKRRKKLEQKKKLLEREAEVDGVKLKS